MDDKKTIDDKKLNLFAPPSSPPSPPWQMIHSLLFTLPPGGKIPMPTRRSEYESMKEGLKGRTDAWAKDSVAFIDFLFKHEQLGNVSFEPELD